VPSIIIKAQPPSDSTVPDKPFDPRKDKLINITTDESNFDQSLKFFQPPLEQPDSSFVSVNMRDEKPRQGRKVAADAMISDDSILQGFLIGELKRTPDQSKDNSSTSDQMRDSFKTESDNTIVRKKKRQEAPAYL